MPNVNKEFLVKRNGQHTKADMGKILRPIKARDQIAAAFAGAENKGPSTQKKTAAQHGTHVKSRITPESKKRIPIR